MNSRLIYKIILVLMLIGTIVFIISGIRGKTSIDYKTKSRALGEGMVLTKFNKDNKVALVLKCDETKKDPNGKLIMVMMDALIIKKGRMNKDIRVTGAQGFVTNNDYDFFVQGDSLIKAGDLEVRSDHFTMKDRAELHSDVRVDYKTNSMDGIAHEGMMLFLNINTLKLFNTVGNFRQNKRVFDFSAKVLWFMDKQKSLVLEKDAVIREDKSIMKSDWVTIQFSDDLKQVKETSSQNNSILYIVDSEKEEIKEIKSENIRNSYDENGKMTQLTAMKHAHVLLKDPENQTTITSDTIDMYFDGPSGKAQKVKIPLRGIVENTGKTKLHVAANQIDIDYDDDGQLDFCKGQGNVRFMVEKYTGKTTDLSYDIAKHLILLEGDNTQLINEQNTFYASAFTVHSTARTLSAKEGVKSVIRLQKNSVLFSKNSIFINAKNMLMLEKENKFMYDKNVTLNQEDVVMDADALEISEENDIVATGKVSLSFKSEQKEVALKGETVVFNSKKRLIDITGNAAIKSGDNLLRSRHIVIYFSTNNEVSLITGSKDINFVQEELVGYAERVQWRFKEDVMVLEGSPSISKKGGGKTTGKSLEIDLKTSKITILSSTSNRTETIIR